jgi:hypothetical protein
MIVLSPLGCPNCPAFSPQVLTAFWDQMTVWKRPALTPSILVGRERGGIDRGASRPGGGGLCPSWCCWLDPHVHTCQICTIILSTILLGHIHKTVYLALLLEYCLFDICVHSIAINTQIHLHCLLLYLLNNYKLNCCSILIIDINLLFQSYIKCHANQKN